MSILARGTRSAGVVKGGKSTMNESKFNGMGEIYSKYRPSYPLEFIDYIFSNIGTKKETIIADIGSGTGILTRQLLERGGKVTAVEPNADMRKVAEKDLSSFDKFISINGTAENTTLPDHSIDHITVAQAFHWFDRQLFKSECKRILKPGGMVFLVWNSRDETSELVRENDAVNKKYCPNFKGFSGGMRGAENEDDFNDFFDGEYEIKTFQNDVTFDEQGFIGRNLSGSYALKEDDRNYQNYISELKALYEKYNKSGQLIMPNLTRSYTGKV